MGRADIDILGLAERRGPGPQDTNGFITWKGVRLPALLGLLLTVGGGTAYIKTREPQPELAPRVIVLEGAMGDVKRRLESIDANLQYLVQAEARRQGREEAGRRR